jgi:hypothetical protein
MIGGWPPIDVGSYFRNCSKCGIEAGAGIGVTIRR